MVTLVPKNDVLTEGRWILPKVKPLNVRSRSIVEIVLLIGPVPDTRDSIVIAKELYLLERLRLVVMNKCNVLLSRISDLYQGDIQSRSVDEILDNAVHNDYRVFRLGCSRVEICVRSLGKGFWSTAQG